MAVVPSNAVEARAYLYSPGGGDEKLAKVSTYTSEELVLFIKAMDAIKPKAPNWSGMPFAGELADKARAALAKGGAKRSGGNNTKLYLLGGAGLVAAWFLFIRK